LDVWIRLIGMYVHGFTPSQADLRTFARSLRDR
jgi:hypothetical protein